MITRSKPKKPTLLGKYLSFIKKFTAHEAILVVVLLISLLLRINIFVHSDPPSYFYIQPDYARDYLFANHILKYGEFPFDIHASFGSSVPPTHIYVISILLLIKNDIVFLGFINIFLQMIVLVSVYYLARNLFGRMTGLIAVTLFGLNPQIIHQSYFAWQPWAMQPFVNLSYLLLFLSFVKKNYVLLLLSIVLFVAAAAMHNSVFPLFPIFIALIFIVLKFQLRKMSLLKYLGVIIALVGSFVFNYFPLWLATQTTATHAQPMSITSFLANPGNLSISEIINGFLPAVERLIRYLFVIPHALTTSIFIFCFLTLSIFYLLFKRDLQLRAYFGLLALCIIYFCLIISIVPKITDQPLPSHYFTPIFGLLMIIVAEIIHLSLSKNYLTTILQPLIIILFINFFYPDLKFKLTISYQNFIQQPTSFLTLPTYHNPAVDAIKNEVWKIQKERHRLQPNFFQIRTYGDFFDNYAAPLLLVPLEQDLNIKLVSVNPKGPTVHHLDEINSDSYIFVVCSFLWSSEQNDICLDKFSASQPNHKIVNIIYSHKPYIIYLAKKVQF